jgi:hypothetical protein
MPASQAEFDKLVAAARDLLKTASPISQHRWAAHAGIPETTVRELFGDDARRQALERAVGAHWTRAEGGYFLVK